MCYLLLLLLLLSVMANIALKCSTSLLSVFINHPDSDKGNLIIAYVTLDGKSSVTAILFTEVS